MKPFENLITTAGYTGEASAAVPAVGAVYIRVPHSNNQHKRAYARIDGKTVSFAKLKAEMNKVQS